MSEQWYERFLIVKKLHIVIFLVMFDVYRKSQSTNVMLKENEQ